MGLPFSTTKVATALTGDAPLIDALVYFAGLDEDGVTSLVGSSTGSQPGGVDLTFAPALTEADILQGGPKMKKTFAAFVAVAAIAGSLAATPVSAQRGVTAGVAAPDRYYGPAPYGASPGPYDYFGSCEWVSQRFFDGHGWRYRRVRVCG